MRRVFFGLLVYGIIGTTRMVGQQPADQSADEAAIRKSAASYVEAFNKHDAKALADLWSPDAVYLNRTTGEEVVGREAGPLHALSVKALARFSVIVPRDYKRVVEATRRAHERGGDVDAAVMAAASA